MHFKFLCTFKRIKTLEYNVLFELIFAKLVHKTSAQRFIKLQYLIASTKKSYYKNIATLEYCESQAAVPAIPYSFGELMLYKIISYLTLFLQLKQLNIQRFPDL